MIVAVVTIPFLGHYTASRNLAMKLLENNVATTFIVLSWKGFPAPPETDRLLTENRIVIETDYALEATDPTEFNWRRAEQLIAPLKEFLSRLIVEGRQVVDAVVYDFFCVEAHIVARLLRLRSICCIPAIPKQFTGATRCASIAHVEQTHDLSFTLSSVSDFLFINDADETKWLSCNAALQPDAAYLGAYSHVNLAPASAAKSEGEKSADAEIDVYVCLGTVVTGNLWKNASRAFKDHLVEFYATVCDCCEKQSYSALICVPGAEGAFETVRSELKSRYPRCQIVNQTDQKAALRRCRRFFVTHGGGNSVSEAIECRIPMLCVPFFGDQYASASLILKNGFGLAFTGGDMCKRLTTTEHCLADIKRFEEKNYFVEEEFGLMVKQCEKFRENIVAALARSVAFEPEELLSSERRKNPLRWVDGDLLFGASEDRKAFCANFSIPGIDFCFGRRFDAFLSRQRFPTLVDHYNDIVYAAEATSGAKDKKQENVVESGAEFKELLRGYEASQPQELVAARYSVAKMGKSSIARSCIAGLDYFLFQQKIIPQCVVHFIVGNDFFNNRDSVAHDELSHIYYHLRVNAVASRILFYVMTNGTGDRGHELIRVDPREAMWFRWAPDILRAHIGASAEMCAPLMKHMLNDVLARMAPTVGGAVLEHRIKDTESLLDNFHRRRRFISSDIVGFRIVHPFTEALFAFTKEIERCFRVVYKRVSERGRVIHLLVHQEPREIVEIQLWPSILHSCFVAEHDTVYKTRVPLSAEQSAVSKMVRRKQHAAQDLLDRFGPIIPIK